MRETNSRALLARAAISSLATAGGTMCLRRLEAKWKLHGGKWIAKFFSDHPRLELAASESKGTYVNSLFRLRINKSHPFSAQRSTRELLVM